MDILISMQKLKLQINPLIDHRICVINGNTCCICFEKQICKKKIASGQSSEALSQFGLVPLGIQVMPKKTVFFIFYLAYSNVTILSNNSFIMCYQG